MLASVTERTRAIGIRMTIGLSLGIAHFMGWPSYVSAQAAGIAFGFSAVTGIFFGYSSTHKAASLDPIETLRYG